KEGALDIGEGYTPTQTGMVMGTPQYISPEQAMGKRGAEGDGRSDLYSLGVVLYEMVTGRLPFSSDTAMGMILHHLQTVPTPPQPPGPAPAKIARAARRTRVPGRAVRRGPPKKAREPGSAPAKEMLPPPDGGAALPPPAGTPAARPREAAPRLSPLPQPTPTP